MTIGFLKYYRRFDAIHSWNIMIGKHPMKVAEPTPTEIGSIPQTINYAYVCKTDKEKLWNWMDLPY